MTGLPVSGRGEDSIDTLKSALAAPIRLTVAEHQRCCSTNAWLPQYTTDARTKHVHGLSLVTSHPWKYPASDEEQKYRDGDRHNDD